MPPWEPNDLLCENQASMSANHVFSRAHDPMLTKSQPPTNVKKSADDPNTDSLGDRDRIKGGVYPVDKIQVKVQAGIAQTNALSSKTKCEAQEDTKKKKIS